MATTETCQQCKSVRIALISSKSSDMNLVRIGENEKAGYVPSDMGIGGGDYIEFEWCLACGHIQGTFPLPMTELEE